MKIPNFIDTQVIDKDGRLTPTWKQILSQLFTELQLNLSDEGIIMPQQTTANISQLNISKYIGGLVYNIDTDKAMANIAGTYKNIITA